MSAASEPARSLERFLGDPEDGASRIGFREALELDEREDFPARAVAALDAWGMQRHYVPAALGGALESFEALAALVRAVARRDLSAAVAHHKTFLGVCPVWIAGDDAQRRALARDVLAGSKYALGLTEEAHGGDLLATETSASPAPDGLLLTGRKWLINNATRGDGVTVFARTDPRGGPRGFSLLLVDKRATEGHAPLPKIRTHGIRGADISGLRFEACRLPASSLVGRAGHGLETIMKSLQVTRALVPALSLGALETALRETLSFARSRRIGRGTVAEIPHARRILTESFVELLAAEALVRSAARSVQAAPERLAVWSAVAKYLVPTRVEDALRRLAVVLGARHYLRGCVFEKVLRDHAVVALFDGSTVVNLNALAQELPRLGAADPAPDGALRERVARLYDFDEALPAFAPERLEAVSRGRDETPLALGLALAELDALPDVDAPAARYVAELARRVRSGLAERGGAATARGHSLAGSPEDFEAAERYARLHAATACLQVWLRNRGRLGDFFARGEWLAIALRRLLGAAEAPPEGCYERVFARLEETGARGDPWSLGDPQG